MKPLDLLVVAPHPDDAELSVGGTILRAVEEGLSVGVLDLTNGEPTPHGSPEIRAQETAAATEVLQLSWRGNLELPNRSLEPTLAARAKLAGVFRQTRPKIIFAPYWEDVHPDHVAASRLVDDARFWSKLTKTDMPGEPYWPPRMYYYWSIHLRIHPQPKFVMDISPYLDRKIQAIGSYVSQFVTGRPSDFPTILDDVRDRARYWGWSIGTAFGEPFAGREEFGVNNVKLSLF
ncbi:MAG: bacillithiol biosynthesis deacetylase BshB1 [Planctomycetaceae bacterium]